MRDTDADWSAIGEVEPYFGVMSSERYRAARLDEAAIAEFYQSGIQDVAHIRSTAMRVVGLPERPLRICDFGSGVGRLSFALASHGREVIGVDIAESMRAEARRQAALRKVLNVSFVADIPDEKFDWVNSLIVFQHIPPERGLVLLERLARSLNPGGLLTVQLTYAHDSRHVVELIADLADYVYDGERVRRLGGAQQGAAGEMRMYDYDLNHVFRILHRVGMSRIYTEHTDHGGCHGLWMFARA